MKIVLIVAIGAVVFFLVRMIITKKSDNKYNKIIDEHRKNDPDFDAKVKARIKTAICPNCKKEFTVVFTTGLECPKCRTHFDLTEETTKK